MKMRLLVLVGAAVLLLGLATPVALGHEQTGNGSWYWLNPQPQGNSLNSVAFADGDHGTAVGLDGTIVHTSDAGSHWYVDASGTDADLNDVTFVDANTGWAVGGGGTILRTTDGGAHWLSQSGATGTMNLEAVRFTSATDGWIVGYNQSGLAGVVLRTFDAGAHWANVTPGTQPTLSDIDFTPSGDGWIVGYGGRILRSTDGGDHWSSVSATTTAILSSVTFPTATDGWIVGDNGTILHTADGGTTWESQTCPDSLELYNASFASATEGWIAGYYASYHTTDGGQNWQRVALPDVVARLYQGRILFTDALTGWLVGDDGLIYHTSDAGTNWSSQALGLGRSLWGVSVIDTQTVWAAGDHDILHTSDGGLNWVAQESSETLSLRDVSMADATHGWAVGASGRILYTDDGGSTWADQTSDATTTLEAVQATSETTAWALSEYGEILHTGDGGASWQVQQTQRSYDLLDMAWANETDGWIVGMDIVSGRGGGLLVANGIVLATTDGGATWNEQPTGHGGNNVFEGVASVSPNEAWVVGIWGTILHTTDGGASWGLQDSGTYNVYTDVAFTSDSEGWVVGGGYPLHTTDAGAHWQPVDFGAATSFEEIAFAARDTGWVVGWSGAIMGSVDPDWATTPPKNVRNFMGTPGDELVSLSWVNPTDVHFAATRVLRSDTAFAATATDTVSQTQIYEGTAEAYPDTGLTNDTQYYYAVFTRNEAGNWSEPATATATPFDPPPGPVTNLAATPNDEQVSLSWTNPADADYTLTRALRSEVGYATTPTETVDQTQIYEGAGTAYPDTGLTNGTAYYYTFFAQDDVGKWSVRATIGATPYDPPPGPVTDFSATAGDGQASLSWTNPADHDYAATRVLRSTTGYATSAVPNASQTQVYEGTQTAQTDPGLTNGVLYCYTAFARDEIGGWSVRATASVRPQGLTTIVAGADVTVTNYGAVVILDGDLESVSGPVPARMNVTVWRSTNGGTSWTKLGIARYDWPSGRYLAAVIMSENSLFQMRFAGDMGNLPSTTPNVGIQSRAYLPRPVAASSVSVRSYLAVSGLLLTPHDGTTKLYLYRYVSGAWRFYAERDARNYKYTQYTRYAGSYRLPYRSRWYVKAYHSDGNHAETWSVPRYVTVY